MSPQEARQFSKMIRELRAIKWSIYLLMLTVILTSWLL